MIDAIYLGRAFEQRDDQASNPETNFDDLLAKTGSVTNGGQKSHSSDVSGYQTSYEIYSMKSQSTGKLSYIDRSLNYELIHQRADIKSAVSPEKASSSSIETQQFLLTHSAMTRNSGIFSAQSRIDKSVPNTTEIKTSTTQYLQNLPENLRKRVTLIFADDAIEVYVRDYHSTEPQLNTLLAKLVEISRKGSAKQSKVIINGKTIFSRGES